MTSLQETLAHLIVSDLPEHDQLEHAEAAAILAKHLAANGVTVQKWIPVAERMPNLTVDKWKDEDGSTGSFEISDWVWGITTENMQTRVRYETGPVFQGWYEEDGKTWEITHWMPLPQPPKGEG